MGTTPTRRTSRPTILAITSGTLFAPTTTLRLPQPQPVLTRTFRGHDVLVDEAHDAPPRRLGRTTGNETKREDRTMKIEIQVGQLVSLIGSALLLIGPFCPLVSMPLVGNMSYFSNPSGPTDGVIILALAAGAGLCAILRRPVITALCGMASVGVVGTSYIM